MQAQSSTRSFILPLKVSLQTQGGCSVTQFQLPAKRIRNCKHWQSLKNPSSERKTIIRCTLSESKYASEEPKDEHAEGFFRKIDIWKHLNGLYKFSRPYVVMDSLVAISSISLLPLKSTADLSLPFVVGVLQALVPSMIMNLYAVGLNQLSDLEIDKVNKPYLALPSGEISTGLGMAITSVYLLTSLTIGIRYQSPPLLAALLARFLLLTAYSAPLPFLRWKRNAFLAAICVLTPKTLDNIATFIHIQKYVLGRPLVFTRSLVFAVAFMILFGVIVALSKDIEDVDGDREHGIQSLAVILGKEKVFWLCIGMLLTGYGSAVAVGVSSSSLTSKLVTVLGHGVLASILWLRALAVDLDNNASMGSFYMFIFQLVYAEWLLIPFIR